jgi:hypothetical protein
VDVHRGSSGIGSPNGFIDNLLGGERQIGCLCGKGNIAGQGSGDNELFHPYLAPFLKPTGSNRKLLNGDPFVKIAKVDAS